MMIHRAKVRSTSAHPITKEEHARYSEQLASFQTPLIQMPAYRQLQDPDRPLCDAAEGRCVFSADRAQPVWAL